MDWYTPTNMKLEFIYSSLLKCQNINMLKALLICFWNKLINCIIVFIYLHTLSAGCWYTYISLLFTLYFFLLNSLRHQLDMPIGVRNVQYLTYTYYQQEKSQSQRISKALMLCDPSMFLPSYISSVKYFSEKLNGIYKLNSGFV